MLPGTKNLLWDSLTYPNNIVLSPSHIKSGFMKAVKKLKVLLYTYSKFCMSNYSKQGYLYVDIPEVLNYKLFESNLNLDNSQWFMYQMGLSFPGLYL